MSDDTDYKLVFFVHHRSQIPSEAWLESDADLRQMVFRFSEDLRRDILLKVGGDLAGYIGANHRQVVDHAVSFTVWYCDDSRDGKKVAMEWVSIPFVFSGSLSEERLIIVALATRITEILSERLPRSIGARAA